MCLLLQYSIMVLQNKHQSFLLSASVLTLLPLLSTIVLPSSMYANLLLLLDLCPSHFPSIDLLRYQSSTHSINTAILFQFTSSYMCRMDSLIKEVLVILFQISFCLSLPFTLLRCPISKALALIFFYICSSFFCLGCHNIFKIRVTKF